MKIINEVEEIKRKKDFYDKCSSFFEERWGKKFIDYSEYGSLGDCISFKRRGFLGFRFTFAKMWLSYKSGKREIEVYLLHKYKDYNNFMNILKDFEKKVKGIKLEVNIVRSFSF